MFHIITPCSRPDNLQLLYNNINAIRKDVVWHICFDTNRVSEADRNRIKNELTDDWIRFYTASTDYAPNPGKSQINFVLTHIRLGLFGHGFVYVLDDDNLLPYDFFKYEYDENESLIYLLPQYDNDNVRQPNPVVNQIDQAQLVIHSKVHYYYDLYYNGDGTMIEKLCKTESYKNLFYPIAYYNKLVNKV